MKTYYIEQKFIASNDKYYIYDINNKPYLEVVTNGVLAGLDRVCGSIFSVGHKLYIKKVDGSKFSIIKKRAGLLLEEYTLTYGENNIASIKQNMITIKPKISIVTKGDNYLISGDIMAKEFIISRNATNVARITKSTFQIKDKYKVDIFEENNEELLLSAVIAIDKSIVN